MPGSIRSSIVPARRAAIGVLVAVAAALGVGGCGSTAHSATTAVLGGASAPPSTAPATAPAPVSAARLSAAQLPDGATEKWQAIAPARAQPVSGRGVQVNECATVHGATTWQQLAYAGAYGTPAEQDVFSFPSSAAAHAAEQGLAAQMDACQSTSRTLQSTSHVVVDARVARTASTPQGAAWSRQWTGVEGLSAAGPQTDHLYTVQVGSTLAVVHFDQWAASHTAPYSTRADQALLSAVARQLG
ncbi:hypothetical protein [Streptacidiphilus sp. P02-A3a]|uniref:hypothetical protein n=1 Tax=Streptacidiphilus sp. P02-A3a TaxID=2704468 RepID=UPI0015F94DCA|nr:hypothetical protein [Streptacidiphilus sp. P02-A3a]QMU70702.1 hypothetical protein GXP74_23345 [Streptacidiphilus sp. P02-A3a]